MHVMDVLFSLTARISAPCTEVKPTVVTQQSLWLSVSPIGSGAIGVSRIVVVGVASSVDIPCIVSVATIRRTQPTVLSTAYILMNTWERNACGRILSTLG